MQIAVFGRAFPSYAREKIAAMFSKFSMLNVDVWIYKPLYEFLQEKGGLRPKVAGLFTGKDDLPGDVDFLFSVGGDGTFLETVNLVKDSGIPGEPGGVPGERFQRKVRYRGKNAAEGGKDRRSPSGPRHGPE
jgi:NAD kinase